MIDVVYVLGTGSKFNNHEIRFSLRSVEKHLRNMGNVWIVGEHHPGLKDVNFIKYPDKTTMPGTNIMLKLTRACEDLGISDDFLFFNDDHFLLTDYDAPLFPYYFDKTITEFARPADAYVRQVKNTGKYLTQKGLPDKFFDVHTPIIFNKAKFIEYVTNGPDWSFPHRYVVKSIYGNAMRIEGEQFTDNKTDAPPPPKSKIFSTSSRVKASVQRFLLEQFPKKCRYEVRDF
jgi:hypothetical protein